MADPCSPARKLNEQFYFLCHFLFSRFFACLFIRVYSFNRLTDYAFLTRRSVLINLKGVRKYLPLLAGKDTLIRQMPVREVQNKITSFKMSPRNSSMYPSRFIQYHLYEVLNRQLGNICTYTMYTGIVESDFMLD